MKIRTDFVTNSSSSSFVVATLITKDHKKIRVEYNSGDNNITPNEPFEVDAETLEEFGSGEEVLMSMKEWFAETLSEPELVEEYDYTEGDVEQLTALDMEEVLHINFESEILFDDGTIISGEVNYNFETKKYSFEDTSDDFDEE